MNSKEIISTGNAPDAIGPYSQAVKINNMVYLSGQIAINPQTQEFIGGSIEDETKQVLDNIKAVLEASGSSLEMVIKTTLYIIDIDDFSKVNEIYSSYFLAGKPARSTLCVANLPKGAKIEIDAMAGIIIQQRTI